ERSGPLLGIVLPEKRTGDSKLAMARADAWARHVLGVSRIPFAMMFVIDRPQPAVYTSRGFLRGRSPMGWYWRFFLGVWGLLLASTVLSAGASPQEQAIAEVERWGGQVRVDERDPLRPVVEVSFLNPKLTDQGLKCLSRLTRLQSLNLDNTWVRDAG